MRVVYITDPSFFDLDISLTRELSKICELRVILIVTPRARHKAAFSIDNTLEKAAIIPTIQYPGLEKYENLIDFSIWSIANNPAKSMLDYCRLSHKIKTFICDYKPDVVHASTTCLTSITLMPFIRRLPCTLLTVHDPIPHSRPNALSYFIRCRYPYRSYKKLLFLSPALVNDFIQEEKIEKNRILFSRLGIYDYLRTYPVITNRLGRYVLFFGNIEPYKGVDILVEAYCRSRCKEEGIKLVIAGNGKIPQCAQCDSILYINKYLANEELANLIRHCEFVVLPYRSATQSGCLMSAFAFNKPVLGTKVGDLPLEIEDHVTGMIVEANSMDDLLSGLNEMMRADKKVMEENIKKKYSDGGKISWEVIAQELINDYKLVLAQGCHE